MLSSVDKSICYKCKSILRIHKCKKMLNLHAPPGQSKTTNPEERVNVRNKRG
jgi:hypothetical protein